MRISVLFTAAILAATPAALVAQACQPVTFQSDFTAGDILGTAPAEGVLCYMLQLTPGQNVSLEVVTGDNVAITVPGYFDARSDRTYIGDLPARLEVRVFQLMRSVTPQPFTLRIRFEPPGNG